MTGSVLLSGQLSAGLGHEVSNKISALEIQVRNLQNVCQGLQETPEQFGQAKEMQANILRTVCDLKETVHLFQNLTKHDEAPYCQVNAVIRQTHDLLEPILNKEYVRFVLDLADELPFIAGNPLHLQQALLNVLLNAVQHMQRQERSTRRLKITTTLDTQPVARPLKMTVQDSGTGIHRKLWKKIFELGYSTRSDGTGFGLYLTRSLIENMGGRIYVRKSYIPLGTTFVIELPILEERR